MDETPTANKKRARPSKGADGAAAQPPPPPDELDEVDDELISWPASAKKTKRRKSEAGGRERSESVRATSADPARRSESRAVEGADAEVRKDEPSDHEDEDAESDVAEGDALAEDEFSRQQAMYAAQQRNMGLLSHLMDSDQLERHMASRRGTLNKGSVRKSVNQHIVLAASGVGKVFVGEMVEQARAVQRERQEHGALKPVHLYEAYRRFKLEQERPGRYPPGLSSGAPGLGNARRMF